jgi:hypothetical protein
VSCILVVSHFFNVVLRTLGQPGPVAQILVINDELVIVSFYIIYIELK